MTDVSLFLSFIKQYVVQKTLLLSQQFEAVKDIIVSFLIAKRGKYSSSFLNSSLIILVAIAIVAGPIIAENNPFTPLFTQPINQQNQSSVVSYNPYETALSTVISSKPRDKVENYVVKSGDTLASIGKKFGVSVDTIKWANDLKSDTIKPEQTLKIPPVTGVVHTVVSGETVYSIAKKYKTTAQNIVNFIFNDFADIDTFALRAGQTLFVPDGVIEPEQPKYFAQAPQYANAIAGVRGSTTFIWPTTGIITQYPTWYHQAFDIASNGGPAIIAADTGTVTYAGCINWGYGCHVVVDHGNGYQTLYGHMSVISVNAGQAVNQGQQLGNMGSTGRSTGPHLHFEIRLNGVLQNPQEYLR
ncbi:MAG: M23 family metallopeptidase [Candidatus Roizmanbacteria bacterium]|nr:M23 family metallopeptidase [Candidatus Roizmanbacteria bacterium]